jgi:hypothetical protein
VSFHEGKVCEMTGKVSGSACREVWPEDAFPYGTSNHLHQTTFKSRMAVWEITGKFDGIFSVCVQMPAHTTHCGKVCRTISKRARNSLGWNF